MKSIKVYNLRNGKAVENCQLISSYCPVDGDEYTFSFTSENNTVENRIKFYSLTEGAISSCGQFKIDGRDEVNSFIVRRKDGKVASSVEPITPEMLGYDSPHSHFYLQFEGCAAGYNAVFYSTNDGALSGCGCFTIEHTEQSRVMSLEDEIRKVTNCPTGADLVTWCRFLRTGQLGGCENPVKCYAAIEDAIHYHKIGAYSAEALDQILAIIVNEEAKRTNS